jgi:hypothetical protein
MGIAFLLKEYMIAASDASVVQACKAFDRGYVVTSHGDDRLRRGLGHPHADRQMSSPRVRVLGPPVPRLRRHALDRWFDRLAADADSEVRW